MVIELLIIGIFSAYFIHYAYIYFQRIEKRKKSLAGKVVLITGSGQGLGRKLCLEFAREQCHIICVDIHKKTNDETVKLIAEISNSIRVLAYKVDITNYKEVHELGKKVLQEFESGIDILINNASVIQCAQLLDQDPNFIAKQIDVNVIGHFWTIQTFLPKMLAKNDGYIVAVASVAGKIPLEGLVPYCTTKYAVTGLMEALTVELHSMGANIKTVTICPGFIATKFLPEPFGKPGFKWVNNVPLVVTKPSLLAKQIVTAVKEERRVYYNQIIYPILFALACVFPLSISDWFHAKYIVTTKNLYATEKKQSK